MIPKIIHYCWFGKGALPDEAKRCIASWSKFFPDYEIKEWNEENFDINIIPYTKQAYDEKKYAFVSDFARYWILYQFGGIYFDTDVEVIKEMNTIIASGPFLGFEIDPNHTLPFGAVNPGLGMGAEPKMSFYKRIIDYYTTIDFKLHDGSLNIKDAVVNITTRELAFLGLKREYGIQHISYITIYPSCYFNPLDDATGRLQTTKETYTIHWYTKSWLPTSPTRIKLSRLLRRVLGGRIMEFLRTKIRKP